jgi:cell division protein FtsN
LRDHRPLSSVKELVSPKSADKKESSSSKKPASAKKSTPTKKSTPAKKSTSTKSTASHKTKSDKVVAKKTTSSHKSTPSKKHTSAKSVVGHTLTSGYYIKIGTFKDSASAVQQIKKTGLNYKLIKVKNDKTLTRVFIGTFSSKAKAQSNLSKAKKISKGAYIIKK